ncbi:cysteine synthase CysM [Aeromonas caviae]|uniref:Cysteine synthase B n=1 Tax=Aeromonas caviae TaxID=648 RepID=A0AAJ5ZDX0_AERCA|nr:cysteine synthase CysM [Aeromonas caviae]WFF99151.1 cysteine synthase CysM [Aeromonas caviae]
MAFATLDDLIGNTPLLALRRINPHPGVTLLVKLEGNNPAGSVKDRAALNLIRQAEASGHLAPGARLIEATSGNTGIALAMVAASRGYRMRLIMPSNMSQERRDAMQARGEGLVLDQFNNPANPDAHYRSTGPEIWRQSGGAVTHFVSAMGTTGTIMGVSRYLKEQNPAVAVIGLQPAEGSQIPGIRRWPEAYRPAIFEPARVDGVLDVTLEESLVMMRRLAREEGICCGVSSGGAVAGALRVAAEIGQGVVVAIICDRGDRYLSTGVFTPDA